MSEIWSFRVKSTGKYVEWKVENFFSVTKNKKYFLQSPKFMLSNVECYILIQPIDANTASVSDFSMVLERDSLSPQDYGVSYSIGIKSRDGSKYKSKCVRFVSKVGGSESKADDGKKKNCMIVELNTLWKSKKDLSYDNSLMVFCDALIVDVTDVGTVFSVPLWNNEEKLIENLKCLLLDGLHSDTTINVKDRGFKVHRSVLSARSSVFRSMFDHDMTEKNCGVVNIDDCEPDTVQDFLLYVYTGKTDHVTSENAPSLYRIADKYHTPLLKNECSSLMEKELTIHSFCDVVLIASTYDDTELMAAATTFFTENFTNIFSTPKWMTLLSEQPALTHELLVAMGDAVNKRLMMLIPSSTVLPQSPEQSPSQAPTMQMFVKTYEGTVMIDIARIDTVKELAKSVLSRMCRYLNLRDVYLTYGAKNLDMEKSLFHYHIQRGSTVYLNTRNDNPRNN